MRKLREAGKPTKPATVHELRASSSDRSLRKGDRTVDELATDGRQTLLDVGIAHPLVDTYRKWALSAAAETPLLSRG